MGAMWSDEVDEEEKLKSKKTKSKKSTKSSFFDDFSFSEIDEHVKDEDDDLEELVEEEEPIYVAPPVLSIKKRGSKSKSKSVRFAKMGARRGTKKNMY